jgi:DtxR family Mn-dependent transcriptional regulator
MPLEVSSAVQDYAKAIYSLEQRCDGGAVTTNALAERLGVSAASASGMVKRLDGLGLVEHVPYKGVVLTGRGMKVALEVLRHHRLLERYLAQELGVPWDRVHDEAEVLEHVLSEELEELISAKLGHPTTDPHGDPIPTADLVRRWRPGTPAASCGSPTPIPRCCATSARGASRPATASRCSRSSRSAARSSRGSG